MEKEKLVSIIIPVYNVKPYLKEAINSVLCQSYQNLEILVIDDGSTDGSGEICDECEKMDDRVIVVHQENQGLSGTRNTGLDLIKGEMVAFLDSDDALHPDYVNVMLNVMNQENADIVICKYTNPNTDGVMVLSVDSRRFPLIEADIYDRKSAFYNLIDGKNESYRLQ